MIENALDYAITHGMAHDIGGHRYYHFHWYTIKREAMNDASDARQYGFKARVIPTHGGWSLVVMKKTTAKREKDPYSHYDEHMRKWRKTLRTEGITGSPNYPVKKKK